MAEILLIIHSVIYRIPSSGEILYKGEHGFTPHYGKIILSTNNGGLKNGTSQNYIGR